MATRGPSRRWPPWWMKSSASSRVSRRAPRWSTFADMAQGSRPDRVGEEIREELATLLAREVHDPGIGFVTLTRVKVSPDLQMARVFYTVIGDDKTQKATAQALTRATPFLRRHIGARIRLRRVPEIRF